MLHSPQEFLKDLAVSSDMLLGGVRIDSLLGLHSHTWIDKNSDHMLCVLLIVVCLYIKCMYVFANVCVCNSCVKVLYICLCMCVCGLTIPLLVHISPHTTSTLPHNHTS